MTRRPVLFQLVCPARCLDRACRRLVVDGHLIPTDVKDPEQAVQLIVDAAERRGLNAVFAYHLIDLAVDGTRFKPFSDETPYPVVVIDGLQYFVIAEHTANIAVPASPEIVPVVPVTPPHGLHRIRTRPTQLAATDAA